jgi:hypothetical protein
MAALPWWQCGVFYEIAPISFQDYIFTDDRPEHVCEENAILIALNTVHQPRLGDWRARGALLLSTYLDEEQKDLTGPTLLRPDEGIIVKLRTWRMQTARWWQTGAIYQIYPRSFQDTDSDGVGDLRGIIQRLPYLVELGVDAIWISRRAEVHLDIRSAGQSVVFSPLLRLSAW